MRRRSIMSTQPHPIKAGLAPPTSFIESLETRVLLDAPKPTLDANGRLSITGTSSNDRITVGLTTDPTKLDVIVDGGTTRFTTAKVTRIVAIGAAGNDRIAVSRLHG